MGDAVHFTIAHGVVVKLSAEDIDKVSKYTWSMWRKYPSKSDIKLHHFIIGPRPDDVPEDYVVDHANRDYLDASKPNLRWVSSSFNNWNRVVKKGRSSFRGVQWEFRTSKWTVQFRGRTIGAFPDERQAFIAYATEAVREWPLWAPTSDLLVGDGLLSKEEMEAIILSAPVNKVQRELPRGVFQKPTGKFGVSYRKQVYGDFATAGEAKGAYNDTWMADRQKRWEEHVLKPIPLDSRGNAIIQLTGARADKRTTTVPQAMYHVLTWEHSWNLNSSNYAVCKWGNGKLVQLHVLVYRMLHPFYLTERGLSVDHINHDELQNTEENLRLATRSQQTSNQRKRPNLSSQHRNVSRNSHNKWVFEFKHDGSRIRKGGFDTELAAFEALQSERKRVCV